jgi:hypothetical protein
MKDTEGIGIYFGPSILDSFLGLGGTENRLIPNTNGMVLKYMYVMWLGECNTSFITYGVDRVITPVILFHLDILLS